MKNNGRLNETRLANGLTIISDHMPHVETVALGVWVATGARHEDASESGISHFIEHMAFKGTKRRNARKIVEEIEEVGGELNAATSFDSTAFYARVLKADIAVALEILADIMLNPTYPGEDLERERNVILQEIAATRDSPEEIVMDLLQDAAFPRQPLGRPILGTT
jgi:predicted Zn-dependent peptidase